MTCADPATELQALKRRLHNSGTHPDYEYAQTQESPDFRGLPSAPAGEGWVLNVYAGLEGCTRSYGQLTYHWRRLKVPELRSPPPPLTAVGDLLVSRESILADVAVLDSNFVTVQHISADRLYHSPSASGVYVVDTSLHESTLEEYAPFVKRHHRYVYLKLALVELLVDLTDKVVYDLWRQYANRWSVAGTLHHRWSTLEPGQKVVVVSDVYERELASLRSHYVYDISPHTPNTGNRATG